MERIPGTGPRKEGTDPGRLRLEVTVRGRVQGVGFRHFAARQARALALDGWVHNAADGTVRLAAEGPADALRRLLTVLRQGPPWAEVEAVEPDWGPAKGEPPGFRIR